MGEQVPNRQLPPGHCESKLQGFSWFGSLARGAVCWLVSVHSAGGWLALVAAQLHRAAHKMIVSERIG